MFYTRSRMLGISTAIKTALKVALYNCFDELKMVPYFWNNYIFRKSTLPRLALKIWMGRVGIAEDLVI